MKTKKVTVITNSSSPICINCNFSEPLSETLEGVLYFCNFRGCACSPDFTCHAFENKKERD